MNANENKGLTEETEQKVEQMVEKWKEKDKEKSSVIKNLISKFKQLNIRYQLAIFVVVVGLIWIVLYLCNKPHEYTPEESVEDVQISESHQKESIEHSYTKYDPTGIYTNIDNHDFEFTYKSSDGIATPKIREIKGTISVVNNELSFDYIDEEKEDVSLLSYILPDSELIKTYKVKDKDNTRYELIGDDVFKDDRINLHYVVIYNSDSNGEPTTLKEITGEHIYEHEGQKFVLETTAVLKQGV